MASIAPRRVIVTGANTGIGYALARQLLVDHGCHVYLGSRNSEKGRLAVESIRASAPEFADRIEMLLVDTSSAESIATAASSVRAALKDGEYLFAVVNNAGTGLAHGVTPKTMLDTNIYGPKLMVDAFLPMINPTDGRIVNVGSGAGPSFVSRAAPDLKAVLTDPGVTWEQIDALIKAHAKHIDGPAAYGFSKALLAAYTMALAKEHPNLKVNCLSPGFINTTITKGFGATKSPEEGTVSIRHCLFSATSSGWYYGSDALRSPLDYMRNPGEPEYQGPDIVQPTATAA